MKSKTTISDIIGVLFDPKFWVNIKPVCLVWDARLNELMDTNEIKRFGAFEVDIDGVRVWTANYPYSFGAMMYGGSAAVTGIPKRKTRIRLHDKLIENLGKGESDE